MPTLLDEAYAPLTSSIGFIDAPLADVSVALISWRQSLSPRVDSRSVTEPFPEVLHRLEPLTTVVRPRELLLPTESAWTAYFDNSARGADATSTVGHLTYANQWRGVTVEAIPHTVGTSAVKRGRYGSVQFQLFGKERTEFLNYVRTIAAAYDGDRWVFTAAGALQPFERAEAYLEKRYAKRFTTELLQEYCRALGIDVFTPGFYRSPGVLVETQMILPPEATSMTLETAQRWLIKDDADRDRVRVTWPPIATGTLMHRYDSRPSAT